MARSRKPKNYFEPWHSRRSTAWEAGFGNEPPPGPEHWTDADKRQWEQDWKAKRAKCEADAEWIVWGSSMAQPTLCVSLLGKPLVVDDQRIISAIRKSKAWPDDGPSHEDVATRIAECVTAMAGIANPTKFISDVRALLKEQALSMHEDPKVLPLLARCIPPEQLEEFYACEETDEG